MCRLLAYAAGLLSLATSLSVVRAQEELAPASTPAATSSGIDEIVVTRQRLSSMRREIERAQEDLYKLFNANVSDHQLDMHCHLEMPTGSRLSRRVCRPQFVDNATAQGASDVMGYIYGHCQGIPPFFECPVASVQLEMGAIAAQQPFDKLRYMAKRLNDEMLRLAHENPDVAKALLDYQVKDRAYHEALNAQTKK